MKSEIPMSLPRRKRAKNRQAYRIALLRYEKASEQDWCYTPRLSWVSLFEPIRG